ncbi:MAG: 50S ribosomal protein L15 [Desulfobacteraceae bacterium]|nr:50S ribosomal protein L15 [Desulfobacteraceae bacterium]
MLTLSNLSPNPGSRKQRKRIGRGPGTGQGKTAGRGHKGFKARSGSGIKPGFEGGQMPLQRRLPKRGFSNPFKVQYVVVNVRDLDRFEAGSRVDRQALLEAGLIAAKDLHIKILGDGDLGKPLTIAVEKVSAAARQKIEDAKGTIEAAE